MIPLATFHSITLTGSDSVKFLQGQLTCNVDRLDGRYQATAVSNLKGRIAFALWIKNKGENTFEIVLCSDCMADFIAHVKKFGAFSKITLTEPQPIYPMVIDDQPSFISDQALADKNAWVTASMATGNYWLTHDMQDTYQPQEMRLHQRGGIDYNKGCYLGQEVIARIYFKSAPKSYLHRIAGIGKAPKSGDNIGAKSKVQVVNAIELPDNHFEALVISRPDLLSEFEVLPLPTAMMGGVARESI